MALTLDQLTKARDALLEARAGGVREYRDQSGETVSYKSDAEQARAFAALDREIAELAGRRTPHTLYFRTSKGL